MHPNSIVREPLLKSFKNNPRIILSEPLNYFDLVGTLKGCYMLLTDSGRIARRGSFTRKTSINFRNTTERPEAVKAGTIKLIGTNPLKFLKRQVI